MPVRKWLGPFLLLVSLPVPALAQSPGSVESELKYGREYEAAGKWDYAQWRYEAVLARDPGNAEARAGLARAKAAREGNAGGGGAMPKPEPAPQPPVPTAADSIAVGQRVEFDRFSDGSWGRFGRVTKINRGADPSCPSYFIEEEGGGITLSYVCARVRPAADRAPAPPSTAGGGAPPTGSYFCTYGLNRGQVLGPGRNFRLLPGGAYAADDGERGSYAYDPASGRIAFRGGYFGRMRASGEYKGGRSHQIDISPAGGLVSFCSRQ